MPFSILSLTYIAYKRFVIESLDVSIMKPHDITNTVACAPSEDSDQPGQPRPAKTQISPGMPRLIWDFAGRTVIFLVL